MMKFYTQQHQFYCGVDLHAKTLHACVVDADGKKLLHQNFLCQAPPLFLEALGPFRTDLVVGCESTFNWYWLADLMRAQQIPFILGHALFMKAIHGGKSKSDAIDSEKIARLELELTRQAKVTHPQLFYRLTSVPGIGPILALTMMHEVESIERFPSVGQFLSYCRLVKGSHTSAGKNYGSPGGKMGNAYLRWAFGEAIQILKRESRDVKKLGERLEKKRGKGRAMNILAVKLGRAIYFMLRHDRAFDLQRFIQA